MAKTGSFDLNFPGANLICDTPQKRESLLKYINGDADSYEVKLSYTDFEQDVDNAIYNTTYIHESKHYHDHLICPYLLHNYMLKLTALFFSLLSVYSWENGNKPYKWIPIPLTSWIKLPLKKKQELIEEKKISTNDIPMYSFKEAVYVANGSRKCEDVFTNNLLNGAIAYNECTLNSSSIPPEFLDSGYTIRSFTESMGFIHQLAAIANYYDDYGNKIIGEIINRSYDVFDKTGQQISPETISDFSEINIRSKDYTAALDLAIRIAKKTGIEKIQKYSLSSYILFWALCTNPITGINNYVIPGLRLQGLLSSINENKIDFKEDSVLRDFYKNPFIAYQIWNNIIYPGFLKHNLCKERKESQSNIESDIKSSLFSFYEEEIKGCYKMMNILYPIGFRGPSLFLYELADSLFRMSSLFLNDPQEYLLPLDYAKNLHKFVNIPFRFQYSANIKPIAKEECKNFREGIGINHKYVYGDSLIPESQGIPYIGMDWRVFELCSKYFDLSDALFGHPNINMPGALIKEFLPGIKPWFFNNSSN